MMYVPVYTNEGRARMVTAAMIWKINLLDSLPLSTDSPINKIFRNSYLKFITNFRLIPYFGNAF